MTLNALVVGAGPAGLAASIALAEQCDNVTLIDASRGGRLRQVGEHIPPAGIAQIAAVGFEDLLADQHHTASPGVSSAWGEEQFTDSEYFMSVQGSGLNLERTMLDQAMVRRAEDNGVSLSYSTQLRSISRQSGRYVAMLHGSFGREQINVSLVVDASGRNTVATRKLGYRRTRFDRLVGLVAQVENYPALDCVGRVFIESLPDGWWYGVQLAEETRRLIFMTDSNCLQQSPGGAKTLWRERLRQSRLLTGHDDLPFVCGDVSVFDAATQCVEATNESTFLPVGDAAMAFDPASSWGISKALCDGYYGAEALLLEADGKTGAVAAHARRRRQAFDAYLAKRATVYDAERRFPESDFWSSRQTNAGRSAA